MMPHTAEAALPGKVIGATHRQTRLDATDDVDSRRQAHPLAGGTDCVARGLGIWAAIVDALGRRWPGGADAAPVRG
jgi:hypothetical protein